MHIAVIILFTLCFCGANALQVRYFTYIFQLRVHHKKNNFLPWMQTKARQIVPKQLLVVATIPLIALVGNTGLILSAIIYIMISYIYKPRSFAEPMSYSKNTIKVMLPVGTVGLIVVVVSLFLLANAMAFALLTAVYSLLVPFLLILSIKLFNNLGGKKNESSK